MFRFTLFRQGEGSLISGGMVMNFRKDKTPFYNYLHVAPVRSSDGKVSFTESVAVLFLIYECSKRTALSLSCFISMHFMLRSSISPHSQVFVS